ncbi:hypothetical protein [Thalassospira marina]|uniref:Uncharacterized protein n=1 Tax=Thalassospira marina TaxID=2048283 RepID=A0ABM6Q6N1_9PROT|nr:hypothetical protein [Thalassospira marina]AUG51763.1 hypothetical protein CSC3H3_02830 [Thalassospira marina]
MADKAALPCNAILAYATAFFTVFQKLRHRLNISKWRCVHALQIKKEQPRKTPQKLNYLAKWGQKAAKKPYLPGD